VEGQREDTTKERKKEPSVFVVKIGRKSNFRVVREHLSNWKSGRKN
jgi:hypothetical protein